MLPPQPLLLLDDSEDGFHQLLSLLERPASLVCGNPVAVIAQGSVIGAYCQGPAGQTTDDTRSGNRTRLANTLGGLVHSLLFVFLVSLPRTRLSTSPWGHLYVSLSGSQVNRSLSRLSAFQAA